MAQTTTRPPADNSGNDRTRSGATGRLLQRLGRVLRLLAMSLLLSVAVEWLGMHWWWPAEGTEHSAQMLRTELRFLQQRVDDTGLDGEPLLGAVRTVSSSLSALVQSGPVKTAMDWVSGVFHSMQTTDHWRRTVQWARPYGIAARNIGQLFVVRLSVLLLATPLLVLLVCVGLVDGLVQRDLRRWGGGRESAYLYHYAKRSNRVFVAVGAVIYLTLPVSVHPALILLPFAMTCAASVRLMASRFKKYL